MSAEPSPCHHPRSTIRLLVVMGPIAMIEPRKDSALAILLEAQERGWQIYYAELGDIGLRDGEAYGRLAELGVDDDPESSLFLFPLVVLTRNNTYYIVSVWREQASEEGRRKGPRRS